MSERYPLPVLLAMLCVSGGICWGLCAAGVFTVLSAAGSFLPQLKPYAPRVFIILMLTGCLYALVMIVSVLLRRELVRFIPTRKITLKYLVKASMSISKRIGMDTDKLVRSFIELSNEFVEKRLERGKIERVLMLLPHCIQLSSCVFKITVDVNNCRRCGKCVVAAFRKLAERFGFDLFVSTGGTMSRKAIKDKTPDLILAVACERDLLSGIRDTLALNVIGVLNERPNGPCFNTTVNAENVEKILCAIYKADNI